MSNPDTTAYENPLTGEGVHLNDESALGLPSIRIEECGYLARGMDWNFDAVVSPFWRLYWNASSGSHLRVAGKHHPLRPNSVLLVPEGIRFDTRGGRGIPHLWLHFTVLPHSPDSAKGPVAIVLTESIRTALHALTLCWSRRTPPFVYYHCAQALLHAVLARFDGFHRQPLPDSLQRLLGFIHANAKGRLDNGTLAPRCGRSVEGFIRWFHLHMRMTPRQYVSHYRVRQAARELAGTTDSIEQIAERNGFPNRNYFTRVFARTMGLPPASYREKSRRRKTSAG